ncbi:MAG: tRNA 2-thiocytidine(32) synthetase TtcA [Pseudomonadales bacterium]
MSRDHLENNKLQKKLRRLAGKAVVDYGMIEDGDKVMVCVSGGKDSYTLLDILINLQHNAPVDFELIAVNLDQKQPGFPEEVLPSYFESLDIDHHILQEDTYRIVQALTAEGKTTCSICSRMRRGILYTFARRIGADKIALGHHLDDVVETLFLNLFYGGRMKAMPPKLKSDDGANMVIRPLYYCREQDIAQWADYREFPIIPCDLCGSQDNLQRQVIKRMLKNWDLEAPGRVESIARAVRKVVPSHLGDMDLFDFVRLTKDLADSGSLSLVDVTPRQ